MDGSKHYKQWMLFETQLKKNVSKAYRTYWRFLRSLSCEEIAVLTQYKSTSLNMNNLLRVLHSSVAADLTLPLTQLRAVILWELQSVDSALSNSRKIAIKFIEKVQQQVKTLESIFTKAPRLQKELIVYRGGALGIKGGYDVEDLVKGSVFTAGGFLSTSYDINIAIGFGQWHHGALFRIILPPKTPYLLLPGGGGTDYSKSPSLEETLSQTLDEQAELLLNRRSIFRVLKIENLGVSTFKLKRESIKMYTLKYMGEVDPQPEQSAESIVDRVATIDLPITLHTPCCH